jgi:hypothetical protein
MTDVETEPVQRVLYVNAHPDGNAVTIGLELKDGRKLALNLSPAEGAKIVDALSRIRFAVSENMVGGIVSKVASVDIDADALGQAVITTFRAGDTILGRFAIPPDLALKMGPGLETQAEQVLKTEALLNKPTRRN